MKQTALITGATSGIGTVIADHLAASGYEVIVFGRSSQKLDALIAALTNKYPNARLEGVLCDLASYASVLKACKEVRERHDQIHLLLLNAGLWNAQFTETEDGIEETLQVNLLAPLLIFNQLADLIPRNETSKVMITASALHQGNIQFDDIEFRKNFSGFKAYRQSKLGVILATRYLAKQEEHSGISFYAVHPGMVSTQLGRSAGWLSRVIFRFLGKSIEEGAQTHLHLIEARPEDLTNGEYYAKNKRAKTTETANDLSLAKKLLDQLQPFIDRAQMLCVIKRKK